MLSRACHWLCPHPLHHRPAQTPVLPCSGPSFTLAGPLLRMWLPQPSLKGRGRASSGVELVGAPSALEIPQCTGADKAGRLQAAQALPACRSQGAAGAEQAEQQHLLSAPPLGHQPRRAQGAPAVATTVPACAVPSHCREVPGFVLLCPPSQGARRSYRDVQKFCLLP